jgi:hypothetical protein
MTHTACAYDQKDNSQHTACAYDQKDNPHAMI